MDDLENALNLLRQAADEFSRTGTMSANTFNAVSAAGSRNAAAQTGAADAAKKFTTSVGAATRSVFEMSQAVRANREDLTSLSPAARAFGATVKSVATGLGGAVSDVGSAMMMSSNKYAKGLGVAAKMLGTGTEVTGKLFNTLASEVMPKMFEVMQEYITAYRGIGSVGAAGKEGLTALASAAANSGMSLSSFSNELVMNSQDLATGFGSTLTGMTKLGEGMNSLVNGSDQYMLQLRNLGFLTEEAARNMVQVQKMETMSGSKKILDAKQLANRTFEYSKNLDLLTRITGQRREQVEAEFKQLQKEASYKAAVQTFGAQFGEQAKLMTTAMRDMYGEDIAKGLMDYLGTGQVAGSEESVRLNATLGGMLPQFAEEMKRSNFSNDSILKFLTQTTDTFKTQGEARFGTPQQAALIASRVDETMARSMAATYLSVAEAQEKIGNLGKVLNAQLSALKTDDASTKDLNKAVDSIQKLAVVIDTEFLKALPNASYAVEQFGKVVTEQTKFIVKSVGSLAIGKPGDIIKHGDAMIKELFGEGSSPGSLHLPPSMSQGSQDQGTNVLGAPRKPESRKSVTDLPQGSWSGGGAHGSGVASIGLAPSGSMLAGQNKEQAAASLSKVLDLIGKVESGKGGWLSGNPINGPSGTIDGLQNMTLGELLGKSGKFWKINGEEYSAIGKYQFIPSTLAQLMDSAGLTSDAKFNENTQTALATQLINDMGFRSYASGKIGKEHFLHNLSSQWAGLPRDASDQSYYDGQGSNKAGMSWTEALNSFRNGGISSGPKSGYQAMLHGTEAVVPLPNNRSIPVEFSGSNEPNKKQVELLEQNIQKLDEIIYQMQSMNHTSNQMLRHSLN